MMGSAFHFVFSRGGYFHPIASGKNHPFANTRAMHHVGHGFSETSFRDVHLLPDRHRRRTMIDAQQRKVHMKKRAGFWGLGAGEKHH